MGNQNWTGTDKKKEYSLSKQSKFQLRDRLSLIFKFILVNVSLNWSFYCNSNFLKEQKNDQKTPYLQVKDLREM